MIEHTTNAPENSQALTKTKSGLSEAGAGELQQRQQLRNFVKTGKPGHLLPYFSLNSRPFFSSKILPQQATLPRCGFITSQPLPQISGNCATEKEKFSRILCNSLRERCRRYGGLGSSSPAKPHCFASSGKFDWFHPSGSSHGFQQTSPRLGCEQRPLSGFLSTLSVPHRSSASTRPPYKHPRHPELQPPKCERLPWSAPRR